MDNCSLTELALMRENIIEAIARAKDSGKKVVGYYCTYSPIELPLAAGAIIVPLCGSKEGTLPAADNDLPQNLCPVVRTLYDLAVTDTCPFFHFSDLVIAETTCDGKKKVYELLGKIKPYHVMDLPQNQELPSSKIAWESEIRRLKTALESQMGLSITDVELRRAIHQTNEEARVKKELFDLNRMDPPPLSGKDLLTIASDSEFTANRTATLKLLEKIILEVQEKTNHGENTGNKGLPRILLTGCPVGTDKDKIITLTEKCGGRIVVMENCGGYKTVDLRIDESDCRDPITLIAEKYLKVPCSVMSPNEGRMLLLESMIRDFKISGVIDLTWQACHTYNVESFLVGKLAEKFQLAFLHLETNYSDADSENLRVRIEAFLEMIKAR
jgi:benzoyl-CoA reductase/2-hydroxyglutaryl-CoA dehydratase subunit BcrC/BadD/HgdB